MNKLAIALLAGASALAASQALAQDALPQVNDSYFKQAQSELDKIIARQPNTGKAKNIILFVGDGMSIPTITASRIFDGQKKGVDGESNKLSFEELPYLALSKTYTHDAQVADSAPTATAMTSGVKSSNGTIGVNQNAKYKDCSTVAGNEVTTIFEQAEKAGLSTGVVSTARITHATPASTYAKTANRDIENDTQIKEAADQGCKDIAAQLIDWPAGNGFEVILGGGRSNFMLDSQADPEAADKMGARKDRDLIKEWQAKYNDGSYVWNKAEFDAIDAAKTGHLFGLFERSHMQYETDRDKDKGGEPSLAEMTTKALDILSTNNDGYVLMVEAGRIDHAHHAGNAYRALQDTVALSDAVKAALAKVNQEETLVVVTADHSHVFSIAGYPKRNNPILGIAGEGDDKKPYTTLGYLNGPGAKVDEPRANLTDIDTQDPDFLQQALVPLGESETHAGDDVAILAQGPWAHLFQGIVEQNMIYHVMAKASDMAAKPQKQASAQ
jgi:alkaline phosphatase